MTTQLLILENILWLPLCRINKFGLNTLPSKTVTIPYTCGLSHHSPKGNRWCVDDELLALVLKMIVSPTLNSLTQIWIWWKDDLSGKKLGEG